MRKLIVLIMTSVLATGAVANADTVNVTENPAKYVDLKGIFLDNGSTPLGSDLMQPGEVDGTYYRLKLDVLEDPGTLDLTQVAVCLYDSGSLSDSDIDTKCGKGFFTPWNVDENTTFTTLNQLNHTNNSLMTPQNTLNMAFLPAVYDEASDSDDSIWAVKKTSSSANSPGDYHFVSGRKATDGSKVSTSDTFRDGAVPAGDKVWELEFRFALNYKAKMSNNWKIRVHTLYNGVANTNYDDEILLSDTTDYKVNFYADLDTSEANKRGQQAFGEVVDGGSKALTGITTGDYHANAPANITLQAGLFAQNTTKVSLDNKANPDDGELSLECAETGEALNFFDAIDHTTDSDGTSSLALLNNVAASNASDADNADARATATEHDCTLHVGDNVPVGTYSNIMTVGIGGNS